MRETLLDELLGKIRMTLDPWQREFVLAEDEKLILCCGRKTGKTEALALKITIDLLGGACPAQSSGILVTSRGQRQTKEVFMKVCSYLGFMGVKLLKELSFVNQETGYATTTQIIMPWKYGAGKLYGLSAGYDGVSLRTYSFWKVYRDEDAFIPDAVDAATGACLAVYGVQEIRASTPNGDSGSFFNAYHSPEYRRWHIRTTACSRVTKRFLAGEKRRMSKAEYQQEYEAEFTQQAEGIYTTGLIASCMQAWQEEWEKGGIAFIGADFARFGDDENAIAINFFKDGISHVRVSMVRSKFRTTHIAGLIKHAAEKHNARLVVTDEGGVGAGATDLLVEQLGRRRVIGISNQRRVDNVEGRTRKFMKVHLHANLIKLIETGRIVFDDDINIIRSLRSMKYKYTKRGDLTIYGRDSHAAEAIVRSVFPLLKKSYNSLIWLEVQ